MEKVTREDFEEVLGFKLDEGTANQLGQFDLSYENLSQRDRDNYILHVLEVLSSDITKSGEHRITEWENGWGENLINFRNSKDINDLIPKYHSKNRYVRWLGDIVNPSTNNFDYKIHICLVDSILRHYLKDMKNIYEFGCGPAYHLLRMSQYDNTLNLNGSDWTSTSQNIINEINSVMGTNINAFNFNFFKPDYNIDFPENSGIYTVAALEQVGDNYKDFVKFLIDKSPDICVHLEPIDELLDKTSLIDKLSIDYFRKRNYLNGFLPYLEELEKEGKIEIIIKQRIYSGSYFIEGHSLIVWKVKK